MLYYVGNSNSTDAQYRLTNPLASYPLFFYALDIIFTVAGIMIGRNTIISKSILKNLSNREMLMKGLKQFDEREQKYIRMAVNYYIIFVFSIGLILCGSMFGFVYSSVSLKIENYIPAIVLAVVGGLICRPRFKGFIENYIKSHPA